MNKFNLIVLLFFIWVSVESTLEQNLLSCNNTGFNAFGYSCSKNLSENKCGTFAILRADAFYSSLFNISHYLGINQFVIAEVNGFSSSTDILPKDQLLLIPIECSCDNNIGVFQAELTKTVIEGESLYSIAESLQGLTSCKAIKEKNPQVLSDNLVGKTRLVIPLRCACPVSSQVNSESRYLLSYPVIEGDTISKLSLTFNTTKDAIVSANRRFGVLKPARLVPFSTLLIPLNGDPGFGGLATPLQANSGFSVHKKHRKMWKVGVCLWVSGAIIGTFFAVIAAALLAVQRTRKKQVSCKEGDSELQKLSLSVRTTSEKKVSLGGSDHDTLDGRVIETTPRKGALEIFTTEDLRKATEDFNSGNLIEGSVFHGRLNGKNLAIKRTNQETTSKIDFGLFRSTIHRHPNINRLLGTTTVTDDHDSGLVFEYAVNGSLKDWLHGGLAMKSHFIASCNCFLTWNQRLRICLDIAMALNYMHHVMVPSYVHTKLKSRNIFLDEEFIAKVGNFGMAKCVQDSTNESHWDKGYVAPESLNKDATCSTKTDIFAYGVILLELLSGKTPITTRNNNDKGGEESISLAEKMNSILDSENANELKEWMDSALGENYSFDVAVKLAKIARSCTDKDPCLRPSASDIVEKLSIILMPVHLPAEKDQSSSCESSSKPLVLAVQNNV